MATAFASAASSSRPANSRYSIPARPAPAIVTSQAVLKVRDEVNSWRTRATPRVTLPRRTALARLEIGTWRLFASKNTKPTDSDVKRITDLEIVEPEAERDAEQAALAVAAASVFGAGVWAVLGPAKGEEYFAGYLLEQSLSVDNLFVFVLVFSQFQTPAESQKVVLSYGIWTAAVLRLILILLGADAVEKWKPILLVFAGILLFSSGKLLLAGDDDDDEEDLSNNQIVQFSKTLFDFSDTYDGDKFFTAAAEGGKQLATPLLLVLLIIELSDVIFAVDSIPAVFGVTLDPFIVYSSNMFAILSLRGLYSFVSNVLTKLKYLEKSVAVVLGVIGGKIVAEFFGAEVPTSASLAAVVTILGAGVAASLLLGDDSDDESEEE